MSVSKERAFLVKSRDGRTLLLVGPNVYWDPEVFGISAEAVMPHARTFVTYKGTTYFLKDALVMHFLDDATSVSIEAEFHRKVRDV
jgi:hypothetical protein